MNALAYYKWSVPGAISLIYKVQRTTGCGRKNSEDLQVKHAIIECFQIWAGDRRRWIPQIN